MKTLRWSLLATALILSGPAVAQVAATSPAPNASAPPAEPRRVERRVMVVDGTPGGYSFGNVSPEGRAMLLDALRANQEADRLALRKARDEVNRLIAADRLDLAAVRRAMAEERKLVSDQQARRQEAMLAVLPKLSEADRKAFAEAAMRGRENVDARADAWRKWADDVRARLRDVPPPPPPPAPPARSSSSI
ncbi:hypothetical protein [Thermaurantiacus sp.]